MALRKILINFPQQQYRKSMRNTFKAGLLFLGLALLSGCKAYNCGCPMSSQPSGKILPPTHQSAR
jgi:hypothetical protein